MITFERSDTELKVIVETNLGSSYWLYWKCSDKQYAMLLREHIEQKLSRKLEQIRRESYEQGWKDAKSKKVAKKTWFKSWW